MKRNTSRSQLLLLEDVIDLGRSGDVVNVKPGYARNYLLPNKKGVVADVYTLRLQARLKEERIKRAEVDRQEAEGLAEKINNMTLDYIVKVDPDGHMYGSVAVVDVIRIMGEQGIELERRNVILPQPIKTLGTHKIQLKLKEGIPAAFTLNVNSETPLPQPLAEPEKK